MILHECQRCGEYSNKGVYVESFRTFFYRPFICYDCLNKKEKVKFTNCTNSAVEDKE